MILFNSDGDSEKEQFYLDITKRYRVDGVIAVPILQDNLCWPSCIDRLDVPAVAVTRRVEGLDAPVSIGWVSRRGQALSAPALEFVKELDIYCRDI